MDLELLGVTTQLGGLRQRLFQGGFEAVAAAALDGVQIEGLHRPRVRGAQLGQALGGHTAAIFDRVGPAGEGVADELRPDQPFGGLQAVHPVAERRDHGAGLQVVQLGAPDGEDESRFGQRIAPGRPELAAGRPPAGVDRLEVDRGTRNRGRVVEEHLLDDLGALVAAAVDPDDLDDAVVLPHGHVDQAAGVQIQFQDGGRAQHGHPRHDFTAGDPGAHAHPGGIQALSQFVILPRLAVERPGPAIHRQVHGGGDFLESGFGGRRVGGRFLGR